MPLGIPCKVDVKSLDRFVEQFQSSFLNSPHTLLIQLVIITDTISNGAVNCFWNALIRSTRTKDVLLDLR